MLSLSKSKPNKLIIRAYQVGFGDCFLMTFQYPGHSKKSPNERHVLVDFGSTGMPEGVNPTEQMMAVAEDIKERCDGKLNMVVATHRHKDHISGFTTKENGEGSGDVIASLSPDMVVQPWTEDPKTKDPKIKGKKKKTKNAIAESTLRIGNSHYLAALGDMNTLAEAMTAEAQHLTSGKFRKAIDEDLAEKIQFLSDDNSLPNRSAVANLASMGENHYVNYGYDLDLRNVLPGVKAHVLGPPTLEQHSEIQKERARDENEFWMLQGASAAFWGMQAASGQFVTELSSGGSRLFPTADVFQDYFPIYTRWFIRRLRALRGQQLLGLVRILDKAMNNTSVILLFEVGGKKLLFPGDAQIENWEYALSNKDSAELLKDTYLYKVGHHGSRNATPKTLWTSFARKGPDSKRDRLQTIVSTMKGKHGDKKNHSEVPRSTLVTELENNSAYTTTETAAKANDLYVDTEITF